MICGPAGWGAAGARRRVGLMFGFEFVVIGTKSSLFGHRLIETSDQSGEIGDIF